MQIMCVQEVVSYNLVNVFMVGFKSELSVFQSLLVLGQGEVMCINVVVCGIGVDIMQGLVISIGCLFDVVVQGSGWIVVQVLDGLEGYMCVGDLQFIVDGLFIDVNGNLVLGNGGLISLLVSVQLCIGEDGMIFIVLIGEGLFIVVVFDCLCLVNFDLIQLVQGGDGLMYLIGGGVVMLDVMVWVIFGVLENSNVNVLLELVKMIVFLCQYDMQIKLIKVLEDNVVLVFKLFQLS